MTAPDVNPSRLTSGGGGERRLRVLIVDDHEVVHWGFRLMLGEQPWVERCVSARNSEEAVALTRRYEPHVALVDLFVGQESGAEICERLREISPQTNVLMISGAGRISPNAARAAGAAGFISKDWPAADIAGAVRMVGLGMTVFRPHEAPQGPPLSDREREVLEAIAWRRHQPRDRRRRCSCRRTRSRSTPRPCIASWACGTALKRFRRPSASG